jgi:hypothetical protein
VFESQGRFVKKFWKDEFLAKKFSKAESPVERESFKNLLGNTLNKGERMALQILTAEILFSIVKIYNNEIERNQFSFLCLIRK